LRAADPPVIARIEDGAVLLDLRCVSTDDEAALASALANALSAP
jgi:L-seryl-tRNA(Ser) seleniumtransferase